MDRGESMTPAQPSGSRRASRRPPVAGGRRPHVYWLVLGLGLAIGAGAASAVFTLLYATFVTPLPFKDAGRLVTISGATYPKDGDLVEWLEQSPALESVAVCTTGGVNVRFGTQVERLVAAEVSGSFFSTLGVAPQEGRAISPPDELRKGDRPVVVSRLIWTSYLGASAGVLGSQLLVNGVAHTVVGVMPAGFTFPGRVHLWLPRENRYSYASSRLGSDAATGAGVFHGRVIARLSEGATVDAARAEVRDLQSRLLTDTQRARFYVAVNELRSVLVGQSRASVESVQAAATGLYLSICVALLNLVMLHANSRLDEFRVRHALGAVRVVLVRAYTREFVWLGAVGFGGAMAMAMLTIPLIKRVGPIYLPAVEDIAAGGATVAGVVALVAGAVGTCAVGVVVYLASADLNPFGDTGRSVTSGRRQSVLRRRVVQAQVMAAVPLLTLAGLASSRMLTLAGTDYGFRSERRYAVRLHLPAPTYGPESAHTFFQSLLAALEDIPGVERAGYADRVPLDEQGEGRVWFDVEGVSQDPSDPLRFARIRTVSKGYLAALGIDVVRGEAFPRQCEAGPCDAVIVDEAHALRLWGDQVLGRRIRLADIGWRRVVGVVRSVQFDPVADGDSLQVYVMDRRTPRTVSVVMLSASKDFSIKTVSDRMRAFSPDLAIGPVRSLGTIVAATQGAPRMKTAAAVVFAATALMVILLSQSAVMAFEAAQRRNELAVRLACGAQRERLAWATAWPAVRALALASGVGAAAAIAGERVYVRLLGEPPGDLIEMAMASALCLWGAGSVVSWAVLRREVNRPSATDLLRG